MDKRCSRCGTMNEPEYVYCRNCGTQLQNQQTPPQPNTYYTPINYNTMNAYATTDYSEIEPEINGVDTKKLEAYVGVKNRDKIMSRFIIAHRTGKNVSWFSWVVFLLGMFLGLTVAASWFFYKKMYKVGMLICAISLALTVVVTACNFSENSKFLRTEYNKVKDYSAEQILEYEVPVKEATTADTLASAAEFGIVIFLSIIAWNIYYKQSTSRIKKLELSNFPNNNQFYQLAGMPSTAAAILIPIGVLFLESFIASAPAISLILSGVDMQHLLLFLY